MLTQCPKFGQISSKSAHNATRLPANKRKHIISSLVIVYYLLLPSLSILTAIFQVNLG